MFRANLCWAAAAASLGQASDLDRAWSEFKSEFNKQYATDEEEQLRYTAFARNMDKAAQAQQRNPLATFGATKFSDWTEGELSASFNPAYEGYQAGEPCPGTTTACCELPPAPEDLLFLGDPPSSVDWRAKGAVTAVKDQGRCGSCWAFATAGTIEGQWAAAGNALKDVSVQQIVSCNVDDLGCSGGRVDTALRWMARTRSGNAEAEEQYPYVSGSGSAPPCADLACWALSPAATDAWCTTNCMAVPPNCPASLCSCDGTNPHEHIAAKITGCKDIPHDEDQMLAVLAEKGPFAAAIDADIWTSYKGGIMTGCDAGAVSHGVLVVGFGTENDQKYWLIKNSWAESWGESGYVRLAFGSNQCSITYRPVMALAKSSANSSAIAIL